MGVLFDYFSAGTDEEAAAVIDRPGRPETEEVVVPEAEPKRGIFDRKRRPAAPVTDAVAEQFRYDVVSVTDIDPVVQLGTLEELLTGRPYDDIVDDPRSGHAVAVRSGGERLVLTLTDSVCAGLANASDDFLVQVAGPWSETGEFWGAADPKVLADFLKELSGLARRAEASGKRLYCWASV
ncbi:hypothetical protein ACLRGI_15240 [Paenarthrobacter nitroguajacolicus]|uniref:hypothetical protein n=1 Tax=Paenarthrobacter nitroguajacolicus TaxID=211146 RepID=UPI003AD83953